MARSQLRNNWDMSHDNVLDTTKRVFADVIIVCGNRNYVGTQHATRHSENAVWGLRRM